MQPKRNIPALLGTVALAALTLPVMAFRQPDDSPLRQKAFSVDELYISSGYLSDSDLLNRGRSAMVSSLADLGVGAGGAYLDPRSGRWGTLMPSTAMFPGRGNEMAWRNLGGTPNDVDSFRAAAWSSYRSWLGQNAAALGIDLSELGQQTVTVHRDGALVQIHVPRVKNGLRVRDSYLHGVINNGNLVLWGAVKWGNLNDNGVATIARSQAVASAQNHLGAVDPDFEWGKKELVYIPVNRGNKDPRKVEIGQGYSYRLVWSVMGSTPNDTGEWEALIDARSGQVIAFADIAHYVADKSVLKGAGATTREVQGGVYPVSNDGATPDGVESIYPMPFAFVTTSGGETFTTDSGGNVPACIDGDITTTLDGPYVNLTDNCGQLTETTSGSVLDLGVSGGIDCTVPGGASAGNTHASRSGFYEINRNMEWGRSYLPDNSWLTLPLPVEMNIALNCNATGGPGGLRFYQSGGGCSNTGEIAGVFVHEWGHGMDGADATPGISSPGEGIADLYASLRLDTSCIGRNFLGGNCGGYGNPCNNCSGVRDINWANRANNTPAGFAFIDACGPGNSNGPCAGSVHCESAIYSESVYDFWKRDLPAAGVDAETAFRLATRLTFEGAGAVGNWYNCTNGQATGDGCNADGGYLNYLAADDNDGNLANGTPHMATLNAAFARHEIACPTPAVQTSGCAVLPTAAPTVTAMPLDRGALLSWTAVPNATAYRVYRGEGVFACDFGKEYLGETTELTFIDDELRNSFEYFYVVTPIGAGGTTCMGPTSTCTSLTPVAGANASVNPTSTNLAIITGDSDQFIDSCEDATLQFDVENTGTGSLTNPRVVGVTSPSHPSLRFTISGIGTPFTAAISECSSAMASFGFTAVDVNFGDTIDFDVEITSDELAPLTRTFRVSISGVESDFQTFATKTFDFETDTEGWIVESGTYTRSNAVGGASGTFAMNSSTLLDNQCDRINSPVIVPSANTTLEVSTNYDIEDFGPNWWDRANLATIDGSGTRAVIEPSSGRDYDTVADHPDFSGCNTGERGWAGTTNGQTWAASTFNAAALGSAGLAGQQINLQFTYGTDGAAVERGFAFDQVTLTNIDLQVPDVQMNCSIQPIFIDGFEAGNLSAWSGSQP